MISYSIVLKFIPAPDIAVHLIETQDRFSTDSLYVIQHHGVNLPPGPWGRAESWAGQSPVRKGEVLLLLLVH
jgi:hypothetical protein